jgi:XTP/dITP diphosphohydrolase
MRLVGACRHGHQLSPSRFDHYFHPFFRPFPMLTRLVLASNNAKKAAELITLLAPLNIDVVLQSAFGVSEAEEPHPTFIENALAKARHAAAHTGLPALADDSGLCVRALGGEPGVQSARYAGEPRSDARNNARLIEQLTGVADRSAYFYSAVVLVRHAADPQPLIAEGEWHGTILDAPRGASGFGYDPLFYLPELEQSAAELGAAHKNALSHRGIALRHLLGRLQTLQP